MQTKKQLSKPEHWPDFESLCKKLWGEIWKCPEIKKNGRPGQEQNGVDIYGIPLGEDRYFGIQCKGKDEYSHKKLTKEEVDTEIKNAHEFKPSLKKLYIVTTANKDAKIEEYVREKNIENIANNSFEVHLYSWEDIVDKINENPETYHYYVDSINFHKTHSAELTFSDGSKEITLNAFFSKITRKRREEFFIGDELEKIADYGFSHHEYENLSFCKFGLVLENTGTYQLENHKIYLTFTGDIDILGMENDNPGTITLMAKNPDVYLYNDTKTGSLVPKRNHIVPKDSYGFDEIYFKPKSDGGIILIEWELLSKEYNTKGILKINVKSNIIESSELTEKDIAERVPIETVILDFLQTD